MLLAYVDDCLGNAVSVCGKKKDWVLCFGKSQVCKAVTQAECCNSKAKGDRTWHCAGVLATIFFLEGD